MARRNKCALFCFGPPLRPQTPAAFVPAKTKQPHSVPVNLQKGCYTNEDAGSIRIAYSYPYEGALQAELSIRDDVRNHAYTIVGRRSYVGKFRSAYLAIHRPTKETYLEMAFTNPLAVDASVRLSIRQNSEWKPLESFALKPLNTEKLRIESTKLSAAVSSVDTILVRAEYSATSSELVANAWLEDEKTGFSNTALFHDEYPKSNNLYATQLVAGAFPDAVLKDGPKFDGSLVFVNVGNEASTLSSTLHCVVEGVSSPIFLPPITLEPFSPYTLDLMATTAGKVDTTRGAICSAQLSYTGTAGHVLGRYFAESFSKTYGAYIKLEPFTSRAYSEVYWTTEGDFAPILTVSNFSFV